MVKQVLGCFADTAVRGQGLIDVSLVTLPGLGLGLVGLTFQEATAEQIVSA